MKLLLETVTYVAIKERATYITAMETVMCIMHCRKYHTYIIVTETPICIITIKIASTYLLQKLLPGYVLQKLLTT